MKKLIIDVHYQETTAFIAGVEFVNWKDQASKRILKSTALNIDPYNPGEFYKRELPCILKLLTDHELTPNVILIDGHVYLDGVQRPGLGAYLFETLNQKTKIIGIGKSSFKDMPENYGVLRGQSQNPLYITSAGMPPEQAKNHIKQMHGKYRLPTLVKLADQACRQFAKENSTYSPIP